MIQEPIFITKKRLEIYEFLSYSLLNTPTDKLLNLIKDRAEDLSDLVEKKLDFMEDWNLEDLKQEYYDRFFVPTAKRFVPAHEAAIRGRTMKGKKIYYGKLDDEYTFHVKACYEMVDFKVEDLEGFKPLINNHYPDHLAFELAFVSYLINFELLDRERGLEEKANKWMNLQRVFLNEHLSKWIEDYASLSQEKGEGLYSYISEIGARWVNLDLEYLMDSKE